MNNEHYDIYEHIIESGGINRKEPVTLGTYGVRKSERSQATQISKSWL